MKKSLFLLFLVFSNFSFSQTYLLDEVDVPPLLTYCENSNSKECFKTGLNIYVNRNLKIEDLVKGGKGKAYIQFIINENGKTDSVRVRSNHKALKIESKRLIENLKFEKGAVKDNQPVTIKYVLPLKFNTQNYGDYKSFFKSDLGRKNYPTIETILRAPAISGCGRDKNCINTKFSKNLIDFLRRKFENKEIANLRYTFVIAPNNKIEKIVIASSNKQLKNSVLGYLDSVVITAPGIDKQGNISPVRFIYNRNSQ